MYWLARRLFVSLLLVWLVATLVFLALRLIPGNPAELLLSMGGGAPDPEAVARLASRLGLDRPLLDQYFGSMAGLLHGNLGRSLLDNSDVAGEIVRRLPRTLEIVLLATGLAVLFGIPVGAVAAVRRGGVLDRLSLFVAAVCVSVPIFVVGTLLVLMMSQLFQSSRVGLYVSFADDPLEHLAAIALPSLTIAVGLFGIAFRMTRASVLDVSNQDFVRTARAKGAGPARILFRHVLRNAVLPVVTVIGLQLGTLLGGTVMVEYVFNYPGLSSTLVGAVNGRDYPMVQGVVLVVSICFIALNLLIDLLYGALDPRVRR